MRDCPVCGTVAGAPFLELKGVPVHVNTLHRTAFDAAAIGRGDLSLVFCNGCALVWNAAFAAQLVDYDATYENSLHLSPTFSAYAKALAARLVARYGLAGRHVAEIGCGQGDFLRLLCDAGAGSGTGFDPSFAGEAADERVAVSPTRFDGGALDAALVCCRHVLEHIEQPLEFVRAVRAALSEGAPVYFEVPNGAFQLEHAVVWDLIYAHVATYTAPSLAAVLERAGFAPVEVGTAFGDQYLWLEARAAKATASDRSDEVEQVAQLVDRFARTYRAALAGWSEQVRSVVASGRTAALWGAGAKGVTLLNALGPADGVDVVVDLNPRKQGTFVTGTGHPIVAPELLPGYAPDVVLVANPIYADEVRERLRALGMRSDVITV
jgi:SAM-dependent methyltransferase